MRSLPVLRCGVYSAVCACAIRVLDNMAELPRAAVGARGHAGVGSLVLVRVSFQFLLIPPSPGSLSSASPLSVREKGKDRDDEYTRMDAEEPERDSENRPECGKTDYTVLHSLI